MFIVLFAFCLSANPRNPSITTRFSEKQSKGETLCDLCHQLVSYVKDLVSSAALEEEIRDFLYGYCDTLEWPTKDICRSSVLTYLPSIIQMIEDNIDSLHICQKIGFCNETDNSNQKVKKVIQKVKNDPYCILCEKLVEVVDFLLSNETIEEEIEQFALEYCENYGFPTKEICQTAVKTYLPSFIKYVDDGIKPFEVCQNVGFCNSTSKSLSNGCQTCQKWFKWAEEKLDEVTVTGLWKLISEECQNVPYLKYFCSNINEQNVETFVSLILSQLPPEQCCKWLEVC